MKFAGADSREALEPWRGLFLAVAAGASSRRPTDDEVYLHELAGFAVRRPDGTPLGLVSALYEMPAGLMLEVQGPKREFLLPYKKEFVREVDRAARRLVVAPPEGLIEDERLIARSAAIAVDDRRGHAVPRGRSRRSLAASIPGRAAAAGLVRVPAGAAAGLHPRPAPDRGRLRLRRRRRDGAQAGAVLRGGGERSGRGSRTDRAAVGAGPAVRPRRRGAVLAGRAAHAALRALQGRGPAGGGRARRPKSCRSATSCCRAASPRRSACSMRWCGCCPARSATTSRPAATRTTTGC